MIPHHDPECGKNAIAANNQRQSQQQHAARNSEAHSSRDDREGAGSAKKKKTQRAVVCFVLLCFFFPPLQHHRTLLSFRVKLLHAAGWHSGDMECSVPPAEQWKNTSLCLPDLQHLQGEVLGMGTAGRTAGTWELWWPPAWCHCQPGQHVPCTKHATFPALPDPLPTWHN